MGYQVYLYEWPESQECSECEFCEALICGSTTDDSVICHLNHDKTKEDNCSCFSLLETAEPTPNP